MASEKRKKRATPSRVKRTGEQQFFDVGKVGRVTGITLADTGLRDEYGLEPMDHIFSSPMSAQRRDDSSEARMQESSGPDLDVTLTTRKTPHMPPPRTSTPRHTNIGSPKRRSTGRPKSQQTTNVIELNGSPLRPQAQPANRTLDFTQEKIISSIEESPFRPRHALRRSTGGRRTHVFTSPLAEHTEAEVVRDADQTVEDALEDTVNVERADDDGLYAGGDDDYAGPGFPDTELEGVLDNEAEEQPTGHRRRSQRRSGHSLESSELQGASPRRQSNRKRGRGSFEGPETDSHHVSTKEGLQDSTKRRRNDDDVGDSNITIDPSPLAPVDGEDAEANTEPVIEDQPSEQQEVATDPPSVTNQKPKGRRGRPPKERNADGTVKAVQSSVPVKDVAPSQHNNRGGSVGPMNKFTSRAITPFEDAGKVTRAGRPSRPLLKYWLNEKPVYKHGYIDAIIRVDEIENPVQKKRRRARKNKKGKSKSRHADVDESETESIIADEWEEDVGVISGDVANWDPDSQTGDPNDLIHEDLAHAEPSLEKRDVAAGSNFRYSKVLTLPFFGVGVVEVPPGGIKRTKNCRKNQLAFFMHKGKVMVEVNPPGDGATNQFAISKGGVWLVPRGNDYSITNESSTTEAVIFFCQGSEMPMAS